jgi:hypothetical protein
MSGARIIRGGRSPTRVTPRRDILIPRPMLVRVGTQSQVCPRRGRCAVADRRDQHRPPTSFPSGMTVSTRALVMLSDLLRASTATAGARGGGAGLGAARRCWWWLTRARVRPLPTSLHRLLDSWGWGFESLTAHLLQVCGLHMYGRQDRCRAGSHRYGAHSVLSGGDRDGVKSAGYRLPPLAPALPDLGWGTRRGDKESSCPVGDPELPERS